MRLSNLLCDQMPSSQRVGLYAGWELVIRLPTAAAD